MDKRWTDAQKWEQDWHGLCLNTYGEEMKQLLYAEKMGLRLHHDGRSPYNIDVKGATVADIGCGPSSLMLKTVNLKYGEAVDPIKFPDWVIARYSAANILFTNLPGERWLSDKKFDEAWIYNCLQHTEDPEKIIDNAKRSAKIVRLFEWIDTAVNIGHLHSLKRDQLDKWLDGEGKVETLGGAANCYGTCYYGVFLGNG
jgi:hypothetical protein